MPGFANVSHLVFKIIEKCFSTYLSPDVAPILRMEDEKTIRWHTAEKQRHADKLQTNRSLRVKSENKYFILNPKGRFFKKTVLLGGKYMKTHERSQQFIWQHLKDHQVNMLSHLSESIFLHFWRHLRFNKDPSFEWKLFYPTTTYSI